ncbi:MAG TPA: serine/threonine-protein kinase, partial [Polyangiales bacterium]|nr:serine/threonine-protein kinase [Polyangiales bacterium]
MSGGATEDPATIGRYRVHELLGRGGMAVVYRVSEPASGRVLALKQLRLGEQHAELAALFEREFHMLAQLSHPNVIEVYDYGLDAGGPYYTMELLDGGDLKERCPLPWREACSVAFDVCSSLALLHSRRWVHRDISPRNIRCTKQGRAKLLDFGAMVPVGYTGQIVGTPPFIAPEVVQRTLIDGRSDLYSLGATLYYALTGLTPYPARDFAQLQAAWELKPLPPSARVADIPEALDALVSSLLTLEAAQRPRNAFDVMQRLAAIADLRREEAVGVSQAYLSTPTLIGRERSLSALRRRMTSTLTRAGSSYWIESAAGMGRSRLLDACAIEAKTLGLHVLRGQTSAAERAPCAVVLALLSQLVEGLPELARGAATGEAALACLFDSDAAGRLAALQSIPPKQLQATLDRFLSRVSEQQPLLIALDDVQRCDDRSAALLAGLADVAVDHGLMIVVTADSAAGSALDVLSSACERMTLEPLSLEQVESLFASVFGDVPDLSLLSARIHDIAAGNPRISMELAQLLVDRGRITYARGGWTLPHDLSASELPRTSDDVYRQRIARLGPGARTLISLQALASHDSFSREHYAVLASEELGAAELDRAINELVSEQVLVSDGRTFSLAHKAFANLLMAELPAEESARRHRALADFYSRDPSSPLHAIRHRLAAGDLELALDGLQQFVAQARDTETIFAITQLTPFAVAALVARAFEVARALGRPARELAELRRWLVLLGPGTEDVYYTSVAGDWLAQLEHDSGLSIWRELGDVADPGARLGQAFTRASERYAATPEHERGYRPDEAIKCLVSYVVASIAMGARAMDAALLRSLPPLLEPFAMISPLVDAIHQNSIATCDLLCNGRAEQARERWIRVHQQLTASVAQQLQYADFIRNAIAYGIGALEARLGMASATDWANLLDNDPMQEVNAVYVRRIVSLQHGDWDTSERLRKQAELLALHSLGRQMFTSTITVELAAHALANNLTGVKQAKDRIASLAAQYRGWKPYGLLAEACFQLLRGDPAAALGELERCLELYAQDEQERALSLAVWPSVVAAYIETLLKLGRIEDAKREGERGLARCQALNIALGAQEISRGLALAEAELGLTQQAAARMQAVLDEQLALGVSGVQLGATYEARARVAISAGDLPSVEQYARLAGDEYRYGNDSMLGARYERLLEAAKQAGLNGSPEPDMPTMVSGGRPRDNAATLVARTLRGVDE